MSSYGSTFINLWKRAPLWRCCCLLTPVFLALTLLFPTPPLKQIFPWLARNSHSLESPSQKTPSLVSRSSHPPPSTASRTPVRITYPDIHTTIKYQTRLAERILPLPHGTWHPVLRARTMDATPRDLAAFIRLHKGIITGLLVAEATEKPVPDPMSEDLLSPCHDDRNRILTYQTNSTGVECALLQVVPFTQATPSTDSFVNDTLTRLRTLGLPFPPLMVAAIWRHASPVSHGAVTLMAVDTLIPPLDPDSTHMLAPLTIWQRGDLSHYPQAQAFLAAMEDWLTTWQPVLNLSFRNRASHTMIHEAGDDPMAPLTSRNQ